MTQRSAAFSDTPASRAASVVDPPECIAAQNTARAAAEYRSP
nr:hypothetical protein [Mycolicibacterium psychrotolerans]